MSAEQFSKLSLGDAMVTTRSVAARAARAEQSQTESPQDPDSDHPLPSIEPVSRASPTPSLVISTNNLQYDVSAFDNELRRRAKRGLRHNDIAMKYCAVSDGEDNENRTKYFYLDDELTVAMGGKLPRPRCTCGANDEGLACKHIYWVGDHIVSTVPEDDRPQPLQLSTDGSSMQDLKPSEILDSEGLGLIAKKLKWELRGEDFPEDEDEMRHALLGTLSVFEPEGALPEEFEYPESPITMTQRSMKYQEFANALVEHATKDPSLFIRLRDIINPSFQGRVFFDKVGDRINRTFHALDEYIKYGTTKTTSEALRYDVTTCARHLNGLVKAMDDFYQQHISEVGDNSDLTKQAAKALVTTLDRVTDRNENAYVNITWDMEAPSSPVENNLFVALIGTYVEGQTPFVLDALAYIPQDELHTNHWEYLQGIERKLKAPETPPAYMTAFRKLVYENRKRRASEAREGESKRVSQH